MFNVIFLLIVEKEIDKSDWLSIKKKEAKQIPSIQSLISNTLRLTVYMPVYIVGGRNLVIVKVIVIANTYTCHGQIIKKKTNCNKFNVTES